MAEVTQIYSMVNSAGQEALGAEAIAVKDTSTLVAFGNQVLSSATNKEKFYNALVDRIARTVVAVREYKAKKRRVRKDELEWGLAIQKISFKDREAVANPTWDATTQADPFDVEIQTEAVQSLFYAMTTFSYEDSIPDTQLSTAFLNGSAMGAFIAGIYTNMNNFMEISMENMDNLAVATNIASVIKNGHGAQKRNPLTEYNAKYSKSLTVATCFADTDFLKYTTREISTVIGNVQKPSHVYNNTDNITRHTPKDKLVVEVLGQFASACNTYLQADTFHNELVALPAYEEVAYWQAPGTNGFNFTDVSKIDIKNTNIDDNAVEQGGIIAFIHDEDSCASIITRRRSASIYNPRAERYNIFEKADAGYMCDPSENAVVFYIADESEDESLG